MPNPPLITEAQFQQTVIEAAKAHNWKVAHFRPGMTSRIDRKGNPVWVTPVQADGKGFPDLVLVSQPPMRPRLLFIEVKSAKGKLTEEQVHWIDTLGRCVEVYVWRPTDDWAEIERALE